MLRLSSLGHAFPLLLSSIVYAQTALPPQPHHMDYSREYSAEQILNGNLPGRSASPPPLDVRYDETGFAKDKLYHVPAPGVHPRILFAPEDLPRIRKQLAETRSGRQMLAFARKQIANGIDKPGTWENQLYTLLLHKDLAAFGKLYHPEETPYVAGNSPATTTVHPATKWHHRDSFGMALEMKAFLCLLDDNSKEGAQLGKAIAGYADYYKPRIEKAAAGTYGDNWWRSMRSAVEGWPFLPYAYDLDFRYMTPAEQTSTRAVLASITNGRYTLGMELPAHWRVWNFMGLSMYEALFSLAIEGEEGYDPRIVQRISEMVRDYLSYGVNPSGMAHESVGYHSAGLSHMSFVMLALANRGINYFTMNHYWQQFDQWFLETLQPYGKEWFSDGDLGNFPAGTEPVMMAHYFYPEDKRIDFIYQNTPEAQKDDFGHDLYLLEAMLTPSDPKRDAKGQLVDYNAGAVFQRPNTYSDEHRGVVITRNKWTKDALYLNFECHPDTTFASHDHADRGRFVLSALGRNWAWQDSRPHETSQTNSVLIDDVGQGFFPTYAHYLGMKDTPQTTFASCDTKYAYDWKWFKESGVWPADDPRLKSGFYESLRTHVPQLDPKDVEYDPTTPVKAFYQDYLAGYPKIWDEDSWVVRQSNNPVQFAFRSAGIVRGDHPYAIILDDLKKDGAIHTYKWLMQLEEDLLLERQSHQGNVYDVILAEKDGNRRLLLRFLQDGDELKEAITEHYATEYQLQGQAAQRPTMYRLTVPAQTSTLHARVIFYPFYAGETLPQTTWNPSTGQATFGQDKLHFTIEQNRTQMMMQRNGQTAATTP